MGGLPEDAGGDQGWRRSRWPRWKRSSEGREDGVGRTPKYPESCQAEMARGGHHGAGEAAQDPTSVGQGGPSKQGERGRTRMTSGLPGRSGEDSEGTQNSAPDSGKRSPGP